MLHIDGKKVERTVADSTTVKSLCNDSLEECISHTKLKFSIIGGYEETAHRVRLTLYM
jgi:hypothetical protein